MVDQRGRAVLSTVTALAVAISLWSLMPAQSLTGGYGCCAANGFCIEGTAQACAGLNATFIEDQQCASDNSTCVPSPIGCCESDVQDCAGAEAECFHGPGGCDDNATEIDCKFGGGNFVGGAICEAQVRPIATTSFLVQGRCRIPPGAVCAEQSDCDPMNPCVDGVCCESACNGPGQSCNQPGFEGTCRDGTMAPAASSSGLLALVLGLAALGIFAVSRRLRAV